MACYGQHIFQHTVRSDFFPPMAQKHIVGKGFLTIEASQSHCYTHHSR